MKRAQVALEFILYIILGVAIVIVLSVSAITLAQNGREEQATEALADLAYSLQDELIIAASVHVGYNRIIDIPRILVPSTAFTISNTENSITLAQVEGVSITLATPSLNGTLIKGTNTVTLYENKTLVITN